MLSSVITYILVEYGSKRLLKVFQPLLIIGIFFHVICHLLMCLVTFSPVEKVRILEKRESDRNRYTTYFGEVYIKTQKVSFLKAVLVGLAPSFLSYWFFMYLLDFLIHTKVNIVTFFLLIFIMISLFFSANLSRTDLAIIPEAFDNAEINPLYQLLLIFLSGLITWHLIRTYNLQLPHEIFIYLIIAGFYLLLKYGFKLTRYILSSMNTERNKPTLSPKRRLKSFSRPKYNLFKKLKKKKSIVKRYQLKRLYKRNEKIKDFAGEEQNKNYIDKSLEKSDELLNINCNTNQEQSQNFFTKKMNNDRNEENSTNINKTAEQGEIYPTLTELEELFFDYFNLILTKNKFWWLEKDLKLTFAYFVNIILPYFYAKKELTNSNLTVDDLGTLGYKSFLDALKRAKSISFKKIIIWFKNLSREKKNNIQKSIKDKIEIAQKHIQEQLEPPTLNRLVQKNIDIEGFNKKISNIQSSMNSVKRIENEKRDSIPDSKVFLSQTTFDKPDDNSLKQNINLIVSYILLSQDIKRKIKQDAWNLFKFAKEVKNFTSSSIGRMRNAGLLSINLVFYALRINGINKLTDQKLTGRSFFRILEPILKDLDLNPDPETAVKGFSAGKFYKYLSKENMKKVPELTPKINKTELRKRETYNKKLKNEIIRLSKKFENSELIQKISFKIIEDSITGSLQITYEDLPQNYKNPIRLAPVLIYFSLNHDDYRNLNNKTLILGIKAFAEQLFPQDITSRVATINLSSFYYQFLSDSMKRKISYTPIERKSPSEILNENDLWKKFRNICKELKIPSIQDLETTAKELYYHAKEINNFNPDQEGLNNPKHLAVALIYFSLYSSDDYKFQYRGTFSNELNMDAKYLKVYIETFQKYIKEIIPKTPNQYIDSDFFLKELKRIEKIWREKGNKIALNFIILIIRLFKISNMNPREFTDTLNIYKATPRDMLIGLESKKGIVKNTTIKKYSNNIRKFILNISEIKLQDELNYLLLQFLSEVERKYTLQEKKAREIREQRMSQYGKFYKSSYVRVERLLLMHGFSPYDGYDLWESKTIWKNRMRIWAHFHHIHYEHKDTSKEDLIFIPTKNPNDKGKVISYLIHRNINNWESVLKRKDTSKKVQQEAQKELDYIEQRIKKNISIITEAYKLSKLEILNNLDGWDYKSIQKLKERFLIENFKWAKNIEKYIPIERDAKRISSDEVQEIIHDLVKIKQKVG